jgi:hypothetical protein
MKSAISSPCHGSGAGPAPGPRSFRVPGQPVSRLRCRASPCHGSGAGPAPGPRSLRVPRPEPVSPRDKSQLFCEKTRDETHACDISQENPKNTCDLSQVTAGNLRHKRTAPAQVVAGAVHFGRYLEWSINLCWRALRRAALPILQSAFRVL